MTESNTDNLGGASMRNAGQGAGAPMVNGVGVAPNNVGMAPMAEVNLKPKRRGWMQNKLVLLAAGGALAVLVLVIVGVVIGVNKGRGVKTEPESVVLDYAPEGYGENPTNAIIAAVFGDNVKEKMKDDSSYTYDDAVADYERAYAESEGETQIDIAYQYGYFVCNETGEVQEAIEIINRIEPLLDNFGMIGYYSAISNLYYIVGDKEKSDYYSEIALEYAMQYSVPISEKDAEQIVEEE